MSGRRTSQWQLLCCPSVWELTVSNLRGVWFPGPIPLICNVNIGHSINLWHCETDENGKFFKWCSVSSEMYCYYMTCSGEIKRIIWKEYYSVQWFTRIFYFCQFWGRNSQGVLFKTGGFLSRTCGLCCWLFKSQEWPLPLPIILFLLHVHAL